MDRLEAGTLRIRDNRSALSTDVYVLKGEGVETWSPWFRATDSANHFDQEQLTLNFSSGPSLLVNLVGSAPATIAPGASTNLTVDVIPLNVTMGDAFLLCSEDNLVGRLSADISSAREMRRAPSVKCGRSK